MNEKIKELAKQSGVVEYHVEWDAAGGELLEKFAELIIQQCCDLTKKYSNDWFSISITKDYFGLHNDEDEA